MTTLLEIAEAVREACAKVSDSRYPVHAIRSLDLTPPLEVTTVQCISGGDTLTERDVPILPIETRPVAQSEPTEEQVGAGAKAIADSLLIDSPKLPAHAWMGLARSVLYAANIAQNKLLADIDAARKASEKS